MLTLYHAPPSRSTRILHLAEDLHLAEEMGITDQLDLHIVSIPRRDGSGARDLSNPHPEGKVPLLDHDGTLISETAAIILYLTDMFPGPIAPAQGDPKRGDYLTWLFWYGSVLEPVYIAQAAGLSHPALTSTFRGMAEVEARLHNALSQGPWLLGDRFSAADLLIHSLFAWDRSAIPKDPLIAGWVERCMARPAIQRANARDAELAG